VQPRAIPAYKRGRCAKPIAVQAEVAARRASGQTISAIAKDLCLSRSTVYKYLAPTNLDRPIDVRATFAEVMRLQVSPERIAKVISEGLDANETKIFADKGHIVDTKDVVSWSERRQYAALAAEFGGYFVPVERGGGTNIGTVNILWAENAPSWAKLPSSTTSPSSESHAEDAKPASLTLSERCDKA